MLKVKGSFYQVKLVLVALKVEHDNFQSNQFERVFEMALESERLGLGLAFALVQDMAFYPKQRIVFRRHSV